MTVAARSRLTAADLRLLAEALELSLSPGPVIEPDPFVGALVVAHGAVVGRGYHGAFGGPHAEPIALADAGELARGATLYCTLEPCAYEAPEKRQPPCTRAIIEAGLRRVVVGALDPHPRVSGRGVEALRAVGLEVDVADQPGRFLAPSSRYVAMLRR